jgi:hypothetical protein
MAKSQTRSRATQSPLGRTGRLLSGFPLVRLSCGAGLLFVDLFQEDQPTLCLSGVSAVNTHFSNAGAHHDVFHAREISSA